MINKDLENAWAVQWIRQEKCAKLEEENKKLKEQLERMKIDTMYDMKDINSLYEENKKLKHENSYRAGIVDILPKWKGHIAEETIQDLQKEIKELKEDVDYRHHRCMVAERGGEDED